MNNYSKRTALFIRALADEMPMGKIKDLVESARQGSTWHENSEVDLSGTERWLGETLGYTDRELDAVLRGRADEHIKAADEARADAWRTSERMDIESTKVRSLEHENHRLRKLVDELMLKPTK